VIALLLTSALAGVPFDLSTTAAETVMPGDAPAITNAGNDVVVVWRDHRKDALRGTVERAVIDQPELWWNRVSPSGVPQTRAGWPGCVTDAGFSFAVTARPSTGMAYAGWIEAGATNSRINLALLGTDGGASCVGVGAPIQGNGTSELALRWLGSSVLMAWRADSSNSRHRWCSAAGACLMNVGTLTGSAGEGSFGVGVAASAATLVAVNGTTRTTLSLPENVISAGLASSPDPSSSVVVDSFAQVFAFKGTGGWELEGPFGRQPLMTARPIALVSTQGGTAIVVLQSATATAMAIFPDGGLVQSVSFGLAADVALTREEQAARLASSHNGAVWTRVVEPNASTVNVGLPRAVAVAPPPQRNPSLGWVRDRWVVISEELGDAGWTARLTPFFADAGLLQPQTELFAPTLATGAGAPVLVTGTDGGAFVRLETRNDTTTRTLLVDGGAYALGATLFASPPVDYGTVTHANVVHWSPNSMHTSLGASSFALGQLAAASAVVSDGVWIPFRSAMGEVGLAFLGDQSTTATVRPLTLGPAEPSAPISIASTFDGRGWVLLVSWLTDTKLELQTMAADGGLLTRSFQMVSGGPNRGLASTGWSGDFAVVTTIGGDVTVWRVDASADVQGALLAVNPSGDQAGDPAIASAPSGQLAVAWPAYDPVVRSVVTRVTLIDRRAPDAGPSVDAGVTDGGASRDAGSSTDGGPATDGGHDPDAGSVPDAGAAPDAGEADAGAANDAGRPNDAGSDVDAGLPADAGSGDAGAPSDGGSEGPGSLVFVPVCGCAGAPSATSLIGVALLLVVASRRRLKKP